MCIKNSLYYNNALLLGHCSPFCCGGSLIKTQTFANHFTLVNFKFLFTQTENLFSCLPWSSIPLHYIVVIAVIFNIIRTKPSILHLIGHYYPNYTHCNLQAFQYTLFNEPLTNWHELNETPITIFHLTIHVFENLPVITLIARYTVPGAYVLLKIYHKTSTTT